MPGEGAIPVTFSGVGSGTDEPTAPERAANRENILRIGAPQSRHSVTAAADSD
jgi:hypothetical protein